jgi:hypothetical protein
MGIRSTEIRHRRPAGRRLQRQMMLQQLMVALIAGLVSDRPDPARVHQIARLHEEPARDLFKMIKLMK